MKNYEEAVKGYLDVVATAQDAQIEEIALYNTGNAMYRQGKLQEAVEYYKKALALDPEDKDAQHNLEFVREEIKKKINDSKKTEEKQKQQEQQQKGQCDSGQQGDKEEADKDKTKTQDKPEQKAGQEDQSQDKQEQQQMAEKEAEKKEDDGSEEGTPGQAAEMTEEEAEQWLNSLQENRDKFKKQEKKQKGRSRASSGNDW